MKSILGTKHESRPDSDCSLLLGNIGFRFSLFEPAPRADTVLFSFGESEFRRVRLCSDLFVAVEVGPRFEIAGVAFGAEGI